MILYLDGIRETYAWGLGTTTNNRAKQWLFWMSLNILKRNWISKALVVGDFLLTISMVQCLCEAKVSHSLDLVGQIYATSQWFVSLNLFHILQNLNREYDDQANWGIRLGLGELEISGKETIVEMLPWFPSSWLDRRMVGPSCWKHLFCFDWALLDRWTTTRLI